MKKIVFVVLSILMIVGLFVACNGDVDEKLWERTVTYIAGSGQGEDIIFKAVNGYHTIIPNSSLELLTEKNLSKGPVERKYAGFKKKDFSFYGWRDQDGNYYQFSSNRSKNIYKFSKDTVLEALWRNDLTGELITGQAYEQICAISNYTGNNEETLIIPKVITIWDDEHPDGLDCLVTTIEEGAINDSDSPIKIKSVILPDSIEEIKERAFKFCSELEKVELNSTEPPKIEEDAFPTNENLKVQVPEDSVEQYKVSWTDLENKIEKIEENIPLVIDNKSVTGVVFSPKELTLKVGTEGKLTYSITPGNASNLKVSFKTVLDSDCVTVNQDGVVKALKTGITSVTVKTEDGGFTDTCTVSVVAETVSVTDISITNTNLVLTSGKFIDLICELKPLNATDKSLTWSISPTDVAKIDKNGRVTGIKSGKATVTVKTNDGSNLTTSCDITVYDTRVEGVTISPKAVKINISSSTDLSCVVTPTDAINKNVKWFSSNTDIASVDKNGRVTGVKTGIVQITVITDDGGYTDTCIVTVNDSSGLFNVNQEYPSLDGTLITSTDTPNKIKVTFNTSDNSITNFMWYVDNRLLSGQTQKEIILDEFSWKRTVKCLFSNGKTSGQVSIDIAGTEFN